MARSFCLSLIIGLCFFCGSTRAGWLDKSEQYLTACQDEAMRRYYRDLSSYDVRRHAHLCMLGHGYVFKDSCGEDGWLSPSCYRVRYKWEGRRP
jgi:hypothetical protein